MKQSFQMPSSLRRLFATILVFCEPSDIRALGTITTKLCRKTIVRCQCAHTIQDGFDKYQRYVGSMGKDIRSFPLPRSMRYMTHDGVPREIIEESSIKVDPQDVALSNSLNVEQRLPMARF